MISPWARWSVSTVVIAWGNEELRDTENSRIQNRKLQENRNNQGKLFGFLPLFSNCSPAVFRVPQFISSRPAHRHQKHATVTTRLPLLLPRRRLETPADLQQFGAVIDVLLDDILEKLHDRDVVFYAHRLTAQVHPKSEMLARNEDEFILQDDITTAIGDTDSDEFLARLFHEADADSVGARRPGGISVELPIAADEGGAGRRQRGEVAFEVANVHQGVSHGDRSGGGPWKRRSTDRALSNSTASAA